MRLRFQYSRLDESKYEKCQNLMWALFGTPLYIAVMLYFLIFHFHKNVVIFIDLMHNKRIIFQM
jgi:hypothetical protein